MTEQLKFCRQYGMLFDFTAIFYPKFTANEISQSESFSYKNLLALATSLTLRQTATINLIQK
jgi:hypothetical protein